MSNNVCYKSICKNNYKCLVYALLRGDECEFAAWLGNLNILIFLRENPYSVCPWNEKTVSRAVRGKYLECLKYAVENGCPYKLDV